MTDSAGAEELAQYSLDRLVDIAIPQPPTLWPLGEGGMLLLAALLLAIVLLCIRYWFLWQQNAYRRQAIGLLPQSGTAYQVSILLKRVAMVSYGREQVAGLYGQGWIDFLNEHITGANFSNNQFVEPSATADKNLHAVAKHWIRHHKVPEVTDASIEPEM